MPSSGLWVTEVLQPLNGRAVEIIVRNADLLEESEMPRCLLDLCAHVSAYTPLIKAWERGDLTQHRAAIDFPFELHAYVQDRFRTLKAEQNELIGKVQAEAA